MKKLFWFMVGFALAFSLGIANANDVSIGAYGGQVLQSHSDCDDNHCLDGLYVAGITADYDLLDDDDFFFRTGLAYYYLAYEESYRETSSAKREDTTGKTAHIILATAKPGITLWDKVDVYGVLGYGNSLMYGAGASVEVSEDLSLDAEFLNFDDGCDEHSAYVVGLRWSF
jgi:opacity protein-like surface antigen